MRRFKSFEIRSREGNEESFRRAQKDIEKAEAEAKEKKRRVEAERHIEEAKSTLEEEPVGTRTW